MVVGIIDLGRINGFLVEMIENPSKLGKLEQEVLVKELNAISIDAFKKSTPIEETWERTVGVDVIYLIKDVKDANRIVGYTTNDMMMLEGQTVNYFSSALFKREIQQQGLYKMVNDLRLETHPSDIIMTRTQNPLVEAGFKHLCSDNGIVFFPNGVPTTQEIMIIARAYAPSVNEKLICEGVYGRALMDETPKPVGDIVGMFKGLNIDRGDGIILIGKK